MRRPNDLRAALATLLPLFALAGCAAAQVATPRAGAEATTLAGFGVTVPASPAGFEPSPWLQDYLLASTVMEWRRAGAAAAAPATDGEERPTVERVQLIWRSGMGMGMGGEREGALKDAFLEGAVNPFGSVRTGADDFAATAREVRVPHPATLRTVRYARPDGSADPEGVVTTEAIASAGIQYVLIYWAPGGPTAEGRAAFDAIAAGVKFAPPKTLAQTLGTGARRVTLPSRIGFGVDLPEPFRDREADVSTYSAMELTPFVDYEATAKAGGELEDFSATLRFEAGGRDVPPDLSIGDNSLPRRATPHWLRDEADVRVAKPLSDGKRRRPKTMFLAGRRVEGDRWLWSLLTVSDRTAKELGDGAKATRTLEKMLETARPAAAAAVTPSPPRSPVR